jgi:uncharacterized protein (DUF58 family)
MAEPDPIERLLPASLRAALARRELLVRRPVVGVRHGVHRSPRPGVGRDFRDYRPYVAGDDPRRLDWRAAARSQRLVVRQTESEDELDLALIVDGSGGMAYGEGIANKWARAGTLAAALASLALRQGDRVGLGIARADRLELDALEPAARRDRLRHLAERFSSPAAGDCRWPDLLEAVGPRLRRRTLVVVISDFLDPGGDQAPPPPGPAASHQASAADEALLRDLTSLRSAGHDVVLVQVLHRDELEFPWDRPRVIELEDPRGRRPSVEGPGASLRDDYLERLDAHLRWLERGCERGGLLLTRSPTDADPVAQVLDLLGRLAGQASDAVSHASGAAGHTGGGEGPA